MVSEPLDSWSTKAAIEEDMDEFEYQEIRQGFDDIKKSMAELERKNDQFFDEMKQMLISFFPESSKNFAEQQQKCSRIGSLSQGDTSLRDGLYPCESTLAEFVGNEPGKGNVKKEGNFKDFVPNSLQVSESPLKLEFAGVGELPDVKDVENFSKVSSKSSHKNSYPSITECLYSVPPRDFFGGIISWQGNDLHVKFMVVKCDHYVFDKMPNGHINVDSHGSFRLKLSTVSVLKQCKEFIKVREGLSKTSTPNKMEKFCGRGGEAKLHAISIAHSKLLVWGKRHALLCNLHGYQDYCFEYISSLPTIARKTLKWNYAASDELVHYITNIWKQGMVNAVEMMFFESMRYWTCLLPVGSGCKMLFPFDPGSFWVVYYMSNTLISRFGIVVTKSWHLKVWFNIEPAIYCTCAILSPNQSARLFPFDPGGIEPHISEFKWMLRRISKGQ